MLLECQKYGIACLKNYEINMVKNTGLYILVFTVQSFQMDFIPKYL